MKNLIRKATNYAKRNPAQTKRMAKKAVNTVQSHRKNSKTKSNKI